MNKAYTHISFEPMEAPRRDWQAIVPKGRKTG